MRTRKFYPPVRSGASARTVDKLSRECYHGLQQGRAKAPPT